MRSKLWVVALPLVLGTEWAVSSSMGANQNAEIPAEVRALEGTYTGSWKLYGIDGKGEVVERMSWTDTMKAAHPEVKGDRALVHTIDEMTFEGGQIPPIKVQGTEGYLLSKDGGLGDYFIESNGQTQRMVKVGEKVWSYTTPADAQELGRLGFPRGASGLHVLVKVVTQEQGTETHRISRVTTVNWKDQEGKERAVQFVSLKGHHQRLP